MWKEPIIFLKNLNIIIGYIAGACFLFVRGKQILNTNRTNNKEVF